MDEELGQRLIALRGVFGYSQRELAKRAGVPNSAISVIEQGKSSPSVTSLSRVLAGFPLSLEQFFALGFATGQAPRDRSAGGEYIETRVFRAADAHAVQFVLNQARIHCISGSLRLHTCAGILDLPEDESVIIVGANIYRPEPLVTNTCWLEASLVV